MLPIDKDRPRGDDDVHRIRCIDCAGSPARHSMIAAVPGTDVRAIRFLLNGEAIAVSGLSPQTTLLEYLRECRQSTGTKEGCAEGDCGACTVMLAEPDAASGALRWQPINACIRLLPSVDGKAICTVEALAAADGTPHPVQRALAGCHGSQCGFCTPGFVMSLFGLYKNSYRPSRAEIDDALSGNLCRCTGYRPIVAAAHAMFDEAQSGTAGGWRARGVTAEGARAISAEERELAARVAALSPNEPLAYSDAHQRWWAPRSIDVLADLIAEHPEARIVAGATDAGLWVTKHQRQLGDVIHVGEVPALRAIRHRNANTDANLVANLEGSIEGSIAPGIAGHLHIGAAATLTDAFAALDVEWPEFHEVWCRFASVPIRNSATLGGNIANGSPIGDSMPVLIALGAQLGLRRGKRERTLPLEAFYLGYQKTALEAGEFVTGVHVPLRTPGTLIRAYKISKRYDQDISAVFACFALTLDRGLVAAARIGCGGVAATPARAPRAEAALLGRPWNAATADAAAGVLATEFTPLTDMRASAAYRRTVLGNLLRRFALETSGSSAPTRIDQVLSASGASA
jgi:xanthine dehydrogenase small subunit